MPAAFVAIESMKRIAVTPQNAPEPTLLWAIPNLINLKPCSCVGLIVAGFEMKPERNGDCIWLQSNCHSGLCFFLSGSKSIELVQMTLTYIGSISFRMCCRMSNWNGCFYY